MYRYSGETSKDSGSVEETGGRAKDVGALFRCRIRNEYVKRIDSDILIHPNTIKKNYYTLL